MSKAFEPSCAAGVSVKVAVIAAGTVVSTSSESATPPMHTACASAQRRAGTRTVTSSGPSGSMVTSQTGVAPFSVCRARVTLPPATSSTEEASRFGESPAGGPLKPSPTVNAVSPSWLCGTLRNRTSGLTVRVLPPPPPPPSGMLSVSTRSSPSDHVRPAFSHTWCRDFIGPTGAVMVPSTRVAAEKSKDVSHTCSRRPAFSVDVSSASGAVSPSSSKARVPVGSIRSSRSSSVKA